jgi:hypothetical protein
VPWRQCILTRCYSTSSEKSGEEKEAPPQQEEEAPPQQEEEAPPQNQDSSDQQQSRQLWQAKALDQQFARAEKTVGQSAFVVGGGLGLALLGIAPFTAPLPFMTALLLATVQARMAHTWQTRQLRAHLRRHVEELHTEAAGSGEEPPPMLIAKCGGGLTRRIHLTDQGESDARPSFADVISAGGNFIYFDKSLGSSESEDAFNAVLESRHVIGKEELDITTFDEESVDEAQKLVQRLSTLTASELSGLRNASPPPPTESMGQVEVTSQRLAAVILAGGTAIFLGGRMTEASSYVG